VELPALSLALSLMLGCGGGAGGRGNGPSVAAPAAPLAVAPSAPTSPAAASPAPVTPPPVAVAAAPAPPATCTPLPWKDDNQLVGETTYEGKLYQVKERLPNGQIEKALVMTLDHPVCLAPTSEDQQTDGIHVAGSDDAVHAQLLRLLTRHVAVTGEGFAAITAHHHRPIVVFVRRVITK
jgi:hypothetical protein